MANILFYCCYVNFCTVLKIILFKYLAVYVLLLTVLILFVISSLQSNVESEDPKVHVRAQEDLKRALSLAPNTPLVYLGLVVHRTYAEGCGSSGS